MPGVDAPGMTLLNVRSIAVHALPASIDETLALLTGAGYVADRSLATVLFLALQA